MANQEPIVLSGLGLVTSVGHDAVSATAAISAGISRFRPLRNFMTPTGATSAGATVYGLTDDRSGSDRLLAMAMPALQEALFSAEVSGEELDLGRSRMLLCLQPSARPHFEDFEPQDLADLLEQAQAEALGSSVEILQGGHSAGMFALQKAVTLLRETETRSCVVGAVDCLLDLPALAWLEEAGRLKTDQRSQGFIPGEAAAFLVLERESDVRRRKGPLLAEVLPASLAQEDAHLSSGLPLRGIGLAAAVKESLKPHNGSISAIICDLNGEYYRSKEWALAMPRIFDGSKALPTLWHPAENIGDIGAASAVALTALAARTIRDGCSLGPKILIWTSSDEGLRGSVVVRSMFTPGKTNRGA